MGIVLARDLVGDLSALWALKKNVSKREKMSTLGKVVGCDPGDSAASFVLGWFLVPFLIAMVIGLVISLWTSSAKCVDVSGFQNVTIGAFVTGAIAGAIAFVVHRYRCAK